MNLVPDPGLNIWASFSLELFVRCEVQSIEHQATQ